jgi:Ca2+-binding RTX toxin-like protein
MGITGSYSLDLDRSDLGSLLTASGLNNDATTDILNYAFSHNHNPDGKVPVEIFGGTSSAKNPVPDILTPGPDPDQPQILILESPTNTVNTNNFPDLQFIVQSADADLTVTGNKNVGIVTGDLAGTGDYLVTLNDYGRDTVVTGDGNDTVYAGHGADSIKTGNGTDLLVAGSGDHQTLKAGDGDYDTLLGGSGVHDSLVAGDGDHDSLQAGSGDHQTIEAGNGNYDVLYGGAGTHDSVAAGSGDHDSVYAGSGDHQTIQAGDGTGDSLFGGGSHDLITGGGDNSALYADNGSLIGSHETVLGGAGEHETLYGGAGSHDVVEAGSGDTSLVGGSGSHQLLIGGGGNDTFVAGTGGDTLEGGSGNDLFKVGSVGNDNVIGGGGSDTLEFTDYASSDVHSTHTVGGVTTITFNDGQKVSYSGITDIKFDH